MKSLDCLISKKRSVPPKTLEIAGGGKSNGTEIPCKKFLKKFGIHVLRKVVLFSGNSGKCCLFKISHQMESTK